MNSQSPAQLAELTSLVLQQEMDWLEECLNQRMDFAPWRDKKFENWLLPAPPSLYEGYGQYATLVATEDLSIEERLVLAFALAPELRPQVLTQLKTRENQTALVPVSEAQLYLPSVETLCLFLAGNNLEKRLSVRYIFSSDHLFYKKGILEIGESEGRYPDSWASLRIERSWLELFTLNRHNRPRFSNEFPAHPLTTQLEWQDIVLNDLAEARIRELLTWLENEDRLANAYGLGMHMRRGYRALFHGPSGTGKTLAASLLGKSLGREVYRVDLSSVVSKYVGETAKNLEKLFRRAEKKEWILFFDEGDALFSKRLDTAEADGKSAHFANQDTAYLLQRIENYDGLIIVASNFKQNIDEAFTRRFQAIIRFNNPDLGQSIRLWTENAPKGLPYSEMVDFSRLFKSHKLSAATIIKVIQRATLICLMEKRQEIDPALLERCILDERI